MALRKRLMAVIACALLAIVASDSAARAAAPCPTQPEVRVLASGLGVLESIGVDQRGRVFFTDSTAGQLLMLRRPGAEPRLILDGIEGTGGIVLQRRHVLVGFGNSSAQASDGEENPEAGILRVDPRTGESTVFVEGLQMANGIARGPGGVMFASNDFGTGVDRIEKRRVELGWANMASPNGMVVDSTGSFLFVNQTFTAAAIQRVPLDDPAATSTYFAAGPSDLAGGFDGLARDEQDRLYVTANGTGQILRVDGPDSACALADRPPFPDGPSDLDFGRGQGSFPTSSLLVTTFGGELLELRNAR